MTGAVFGELVMCSPSLFFLDETWKIDRPVLLFNGYFALQVFAPVL